MLSPKRDAAAQGRDPAEHERVKRIALETYTAEAHTHLTDHILRHLRNEERGGRAVTEEELVYVAHGTY